VKVLTVVGNRPQFVKAAAVSDKLRSVGSEYLVHTGQHKDFELSEIFFNELQIPQPERNLEISGGSNSSQTARMMAALEPVLLEQQPDCVLVYGDTNSTLAAALTANQIGLPVVHVEAGMRSFDRSMPEEVNRVLTDQLSSLLLCSSQSAVSNLEAEQVPGKALVVGDVMVDIAARTAELVKEDVGLLNDLGIEPAGYYLATLHRAGNVDNERNLTLAVELLSQLSLKTVLPLHPRTKRRLKEFNLLNKVQEATQLELLEPLGYLEFAQLIHNSAAVITDSGGVQKEAYLAGVRCVTLRESTEWTETVEAGFNTLTGLDAERVTKALTSELPKERKQLYGSGDAGKQVVSAVQEFLA